MVCKDDACSGSGTVVGAGFKLFYKLNLTVVILTIRGIHLFVLGFEKFFSVCMNTETPCSGEFE